MVKIPNLDFPREFNELSYSSILYMMSVIFELSRNYTYFLRLNLMVQQVTKHHFDFPPIAVTCNLNQV